MNRIIGLIVMGVCAGWLAAADIVSDKPEADRGYCLAAGDLVRIEIFGQPDLTSVVRIPSDGKLSLPLIGELPSVVGLTVALLRLDLETRYQDGYLTEASINVLVQEFAPRSAYVLGQVHAQGTVDLAPFSKITAMQAIARMGGFLADANRQGTVVVRDDPARPGNKIALLLPTDNPPKGPIQDVLLQPDDMIVVPVLGGVVVVGKVRHAGAIDLPNQGTLTATKAIAMAGGFEKFARSDKVQLIRAGKSGKVIDVEALLSGHGTDPVLQSGDTLYVPDSKF